MTDHDLSDLQRAADALRTGLKEQAGVPVFAPLAMDELPAAAARRSGRGRWIGAGIVVAAVAAVLVLVTPNLVANGGIPAAPAPVGTAGAPSTTPEPPTDPAEPPDKVPTATVTTDGWEVVAAPPLSPRRDAVTAWVDGTYLIAGGFGDAPCADAGDCPEPVGLLTDGARFDPATGSWEKIADAPGHVFSHSFSPYPSVAVLGDSMYLFDGEGMLAYRAGSDRWETVAAPKETGSLYATGELLVNVRWFTTGDDAVRFDTFDPATGNWTSHAAVKTPRASVGGASVVRDQLVVMAAGADPKRGTLWMAVVDPRTDAVTELGWTPVPDQRPVAVDAGGLGAWPRGGGGREEPGQQAWFLDLATRQWSSVDLPDTASGLTGWNGRYQFNWYLTTDTALTLRGQLYDPSATTWIQVPELPVPDHDPVVVGGGASVLACFGYDPDTAAFGRDCALLQPA